MSEKESDYYCNMKYYDDLLKESEDSNIVAAWGGADQSIRYENLIDHRFFGDASVLEIGCGLGGFLQYLIKKKLIREGFYCGVDIIDKMEFLNKKNFPGYDFRTRNILEYPIEEKYDIVVMSGVFNHRTPNGDTYMKELLKEGFNCCNNLLSFNFISSYVNYKEDSMEYHDPMEIFNFCVDNLSKKVDIKHHYWKCDVSVKVYR